jgi:hypothetical protein
MPISERDYMHDDEEHVAADGRRTDGYIVKEKRWIKPKELRSSRPGGFWLLILLIWIMEFFHYIWPHFK